MPYSGFDNFFWFIMYVSGASENNNFVELSSDQNFYYKKGSRITKNYDFCNKEGFLERNWVSQGQTGKWWLDIVSWVAPSHRYVKIRFLYFCLKTFFGLLIYMTTSGSQGFFFLFFFSVHFCCFECIGTWVPASSTTFIFSTIQFIHAPYTKTQPGEAGWRNHMGNFQPALPRSRFH